MCIHGYGDGGDHGKHGESDLLEESQPVDAEGKSGNIEKMRLEEYEWWVTKNQVHSFGLYQAMATHGSGVCS